MIRFVRTPVGASVQDRGRFGNRAEGHARSGAMDPLSLTLTNRAAGASANAAGVELGPGPCIIEVTGAGTIAFGGARREGAPWWVTIGVAPGDGFELSSARDGMWSYLALGGGADAPLVLGSRSASVREGIGAWLRNGDIVRPGAEDAEPETVQAPPMSGPVRLYGDLPGTWRMGTRADRMGYALDGRPVPSGSASEWSEPLLPGFVQVPPGGIPIVLMAEGPTVGGYRVAAIVHSEDLRLVAQARPRDRLAFIAAR